MHPTDEFLRHAAECEQMAKFTRDPESVATWNRMAERWRRCAEIFTSQNSAKANSVEMKNADKPIDEETATSEISETEETEESSDDQTTSEPTDESESESTASTSKSE